MAYKHIGKVGWRLQAPKLSFVRLTCSTYMMWVSESVQFALTKKEAVGQYHSRPSCPN